MKKAVILFSGGLDSTTCLAYAKANDYACFALSFNYQQRHAIELQAAIQIAKTWNIPHQIIDIPNVQFQHSALTNKTIRIPAYEASTDIPVTYVPARNTIFLSFALAYAESIGAHDIFIGVSAIDYSNYPDCRPEYIHAFQTMANLATKEALSGHPLRIHTPLIHLTKAQTVELGHSLGVDYALTISCYQANEYGEACGVCHSCVLRKKGFLDANLPDPTRYGVR